jgi:hypothetical protein
MLFILIASAQYFFYHTDFTQKIQDWPAIIDFIFRFDYIKQQSIESI